MSIITYISTGFLLVASMQSADSRFVSLTCNFTSHHQSAFDYILDSDVHELELRLEALSADYLASASAHTIADSLDIILIDYDQYGQVESVIPDRWQHSKPLNSKDTQVIYRITENERNRANKIRSCILYPISLLSFFIRIEQPRLQRRDL